MDVRNKPLDRCPVDQSGDPLKPRIAPEPGRQQRIDEAHLIHPTHPPLSAKRITNRKTRLSFCRGLAERGAERQEMQRQEDRERDAGEPVQKRCYKAVLEVCGADHAA